MGEGVGERGGREQVGQPSPTEDYLQSASSAPSCSFVVHSPATALRSSYYPSFAFVYCLAFTRLLIKFTDIHNYQIILYDRSPSKGLAHARVMVYSGALGNIIRYLLVVIQIL